MTIDDARQLIQKNISSGFVDPRTHEHTCREVVTYYREHPEEQDAIRQALVEVISEYEWASASAEQLENAAYIAVNLESPEALQNLVTSAVNLDESSGDFATVAIAAIRSFPGNGTVRDLFFSALFRWLKSESVAHLAFEALCELAPDDAGAYFSALSHYHRGKPDVIQKALTHLYYREGKTDQGASDVCSVLESFTALVDSIKMHPFFPDTFKREVGEDIRTKVTEESRTEVSWHIPLDLAERKYPFAAIYEKSQLESLEAKRMFVREIRLLCQPEYHIGEVTKVEDDYTQVTLRTQEGDEYTRFFETEFLEACGISKAGEGIKLVFWKTADGVSSEEHMRLTKHGGEEGN